VNRVARRTGCVLADRYHARALRTARECRNALRYVLLNARHHAATRAGGGPPRLDPASSACWFDGWKPGTFVTERARETRPVPSPVARARTWLLTIGWRRLGLLDAAEVPG